VGYSNLFHAEYRFEIQLDFRGRAHWKLFVVVVDEVAFVVDG